MIKPIAIIVGAAVIWWASCLLLRKDKGKPTLLDREVYGFWDNEEDDLYEVNEERREFVRKKFAEYLERKKDKG